VTTPEDVRKAWIGLWRNMLDVAQKSREVELPDYARHARELDGAASVIAKWIRETEPESERKDRDL